MDSEALLPPGVEDEIEVEIGSASEVGSLRAPSEAESTEINVEETGGSAPVEAPCEPASEADPPKLQMAPQASGTLSEHLPLASPGADTQKRKLSEAERAQKRYKLNKRRKERGKRAKQAKKLAQGPLSGTAAGPSTSGGLTVGVGRGRGQMPTWLRPPQPVESSPTGRGRGITPQMLEHVLGERPRPPLQAFDSHYHPDRIDLKRAKTQLQGEPCHPVKVVGGIWNFCDPVRYSAPGFLDRVFRELPEGYAVAVGIHPKQASGLSRYHFEALRLALADPRVRGISEVGLDWSTDDSEWGAQEQLFERLLGLSTGRVLVLHLRGANGSRAGNEPIPRSIHKLARDAIRRRCPATQRIHLHCFMGSPDIVDEWTSTFTYAYFGVTGSASYYCGAGASLKKLGIRSIPQNRLLLETDAPYLPVRPRQGWQTESFIGDVGQVVASIRGVSLSQVLEETTINARELYCLK
ncbi:uncharacterized metal-dependent hydrolase YabD-like [Lytechinus variegatus]|uniref:uncharacterized metal-dependent hydrolase YabD-like n=1 Tax=Lytechinus variegatus TaxID=7654 RepID=UPI001BB0E035|nr:uncharacterized metal-dependent hydrolase YabD-like [Lytechinus variegatus]XP_041480666.1 uncharacterized metal-dependent hydrolase YabD-like [Lytechinus variegatus]XP_041480667.1 uncharacterized metal-dependent hydrolase YabD-like [Lytechinus variegatus]